MIWHVQYSETAEKDLHIIYDYIANTLHEPGIAEKQADRILDAADSLEDMPLRHKLCDYEPWRSRGWRVMPVDNYLIFYLPDESQNIVVILRIMYGGRDLNKNL